MVELGVVDGVPFHLAVTNTPWQLDIDSILVAVGSGLGDLGVAMEHEYPGAPWGRIPFHDITPERPARLPLYTRSGAEPTLQRAILTNAREADDDGLSGRLTAESVDLATRSAVAAAVADGGRRIGVPLLTAGARGRPADWAAQTVVPAAVEAAGSLDVDRLVFFCREESEAAAIQAEFRRSRSSGPVVLAGGVSCDLVNPTVGIPLAEDRLGVAPYVSMLATVVADAATPLPVSIGIFGAWGSGKSYFMALLRDLVHELSESDSEQYCRDIVQIGFNAWHYSDSNLWASLADEIFQQLAGRNAPSPKRAEQIREELTARLEEPKRLRAAIERSRRTAARLQGEIDDAVASRATTAANLVKSLRDSPDFRDTVKQMWRQLGIADEERQAELLANELRGTVDEVALLARASTTRIGWLSLAFAVGIVGVGVLVPVAITDTRNYAEWSSALLAASGGLGSAAYLLGRARAGLRRLRQVRDDLWKGFIRTAAHTVHEQLADTVAQLRATEAEQRIAQAQLADVVAGIGELGRQLDELAPGGRLYSFLADRVGSDSYTANLGLVSTIRKDFHQLVQLMDEWRKDPSPEHGRRPIDRIVLYIDDLDRCSPRQVVEVLQAVHLLLAFELFVVVVGVDHRWLLRSLSSHYSEMLSDAGDVGPHREWHTPQDYLEKIFNIPFVLPRMSGDGMRLLLGSLAAAGMPDGPGAGVAAPGDRRAGAPAVDSAIEIEPGSEIDLGRRAESPAKIRPLTGRELTLLAALDPFVESPREAKRLLNLYRMVRATRDLSSASRFLGLDGRIGESVAVAVLLGLVSGGGSPVGRILDAPPDTEQDVAGGLAHRAPDTPWKQFVADIAPLASSAGWRNRVAGFIPDHEVPQWRRIHQGLVQVTAVAALTDLSDLQAWSPRIGCFRFTVTLGAQM